MPTLFQGKLILITGAAQGIGHAICTYFAEHGAEIIAVDINTETLKKLAGELTAIKTKHHILGVNLTDELAVRQQFQKIEKKIGRSVDILVNVVGGGHCELLKDSTAEIFKQDLSLNLLTAYHCTEALLPSFIKKNKGVIVNIGSVNSLTTFGHPCYSAAKAGLVSYTKALAVEFGKYGIRANIICPGSVKTHLWEKRTARNPQVFEEIKKWYPLNDIVKPEDIAEAAGFLASDSAKMITGIVLPVDAGLMAGHPVLVESFTQRKL